MALKSEPNAPGTKGIEEPIEDPTGILPAQGYAESKWLGERILASAAAERGLRTVSVRVGQLCGAVSGYWNEKEWFPAIVKAAKFTGCLPSIDAVSVMILQIMNETFRLLYDMEILRMWSYA